MADSEIELTFAPPAFIRVLMPGGHVEEMKLETYLAGAIAAEIGEHAPLEALKAQAVASRTYVVAAERHREHHAHVCTTGHCQKWKRVDPVSSPEVYRALSETWGLVAVYAGELIHTFFFEHCDGHTRNAEEMLIPAADYLCGVDCSCGHLTLKGHGVGMCKRGAIVMARRGAAFAQILRHYYRGVAVGRLLAETPAMPTLEEVAPPHASEPAKKSRPRRIIAENGSVVSKPSKVEREPIKPRANSGAPLESKPISLKRPQLNKVLLPKPASADKPEAVRPKPPRAPEPSPVETPRTAPVKPVISIQEPVRADSAIVSKVGAPIEPKPIPASPVAPTQSVSMENESNNENFVVVPNAVAPIKLKSIEPLLAAPDKSETANAETPGDKFVVVAKAIVPNQPPPQTTSIESLPASEKPIAVNDAVVTDAVVPSNPLSVAAESNEPEENGIPAHQDEPAQARSLSPSEDERVNLQPVSSPNRAEEDPNPEPSNGKIEQPLRAQIVEPVAAQLTVAVSAKSPVVSEASLPPLEGIAIKPIRRLHVDHLPGTRMIAGNLPRAGIGVVIETSGGSQTLVFSGTAPHYGEGGFETVVDDDGLYRVLIEGQTIQVQMQGETAFIHAG